MIGGIILAAGSSRRFGDDKRKQSLDGARTVLEQTILNASEALDAVIVTLRADDQPFARALQERLDVPNGRWFCAPDSALGMAHSLAGAINEVYEWEAAMVILGDMPFVKPRTLAALERTYRRHQSDRPIIMPAHKGKAGHPVLFDHAYFDEIAALSGDVGARSVVSAHKTSVMTVEVDDPGIFRDIDTPSDLA